MSISTELNRLTQAKEDIATAIESKGVTVPSGTLLDGMAALIDDIGGVQTSSATMSSKETTINFTVNGNPRAYMIVMSGCSSSIFNGILDVTFISASKSSNGNYNTVGLSGSQSSSTNKWYNFKNSIEAPTISYSNNTFSFTSPTLTYTGSA